MAHTKKKYRPKEQDTKSRDKPHTLKVIPLLTKQARLYKWRKDKASSISGAGTIGQLHVKG